MKTAKEKIGTIVWVLDVKNWAFDKIATELSKRLPRFNHRKYFFVTRCLDDNPPINEDDILVLMSPAAMRFFNRRKNVMIRLDGFRAFGG